MKLKIYAVALMIIMSTMFRLTSFASAPSAMPNDSIIEVWGKQSNKKEPTSEQKAEMKAKREAIQAKWNSLSEEQKEEIYNLQNKACEAKTKIIDKYLELGVIDQETADHIKEKMSNHKSELQKNGNMPGFGHKAK